MSTKQDERLDEHTEWKIDAYRKACQLTPHTDMDVALSSLRSRIKELIEEARKQGIKEGHADFAEMGR